MATRMPSHTAKLHVQEATWQPQTAALAAPPGARCTVHCATSPDLESPKAAGAFYYDSCCAPTRPSREAQDPTLAAWLWDWSARMVGLKKAEDLPRSA